MTLFRTQPVGVFPLPAGLLLLPREIDASSEGLLLGNTKALLPDSWRFYLLALEGDPLAAAATDDTPVGQYNRFVLNPDAHQYRELHQRFDGPLATFLDMAAYTSGILDVPPSAGALDGELRAMALMVQAAHEIDMGANDAAIRLLEQAVDRSRAVSPVFAAQLLGQLAALERPASPAKAVVHYLDAIQLAQDTLLAAILGELWLNLGMTYQEMSNGRRGLLVEAVKAYQEALHAGLTLEDQPELFAMAQNNLGLAYLSMPMVEASDQLRMGVAVQSFREALKVYTKETHAEMWASVQLNQANALQYLPSSHPEENLIQSVEIYDELANFRNKALDPVGYARILANQANALAHLGIFSPALEKVSEAYKLFHWHGEPDLAASSLQLVEAINQKLGEASNEPA
jgi:tetratricopeptide (TPR) repeat protein